MNSCTSTAPTSDLHALDVYDWNVYQRAHDAVLKENDSYVPICDGVCPTRRLSDLVRWGWSAYPARCATSSGATPLESSSTARSARRICRIRPRVTPVA